MCQIQFIKHLDNKKISDKDIENMYRLMTLGSQRNNDASGFFTEKYMFKQGGRFNAREIDEKQLRKGKFIVGHNRFSTSFYEGDKGVPTIPYFNPYMSYMPIVPLREKSTRQSNTKLKAGSSPEKDKNKNHHPFKLGDFVLCHNGVISNAGYLKLKYKIKTDIKTDSYIAIALISHFFKLSTEATRLNKIIDAIEKTEKELVGSYSIFFYDLKLKNLFYFKNPATDFNFQLIDDNILTGSTEKRNLKYTYFKGSHVTLEIEDDTLYLVGSSASKPLKVLKKFNNVNVLKKAINFISISQGDEAEIKELEKLFLDKIGKVPRYRLTMEGDVIIYLDHDYTLIAKIKEITRDCKVVFPILFGKNKIVFHYTELYALEDLEEESTQMKGGLNKK